MDISRKKGVYVMESWEKFIENFKNYELTDNKEKYSFRLSNQELFRSGAFFLCIGILGGISLKQSLDQNNTFKIGVAILLILYALYSLMKTFLFNIKITNNNIKYGKYIIEFSNIKSASVKVARVSFSKMGRCLEIITNDRKKFVIRLNIHDVAKFLKIVQNNLGERLLIADEEKSI